jgi:hypothetical protein
VVAVEYEFDRLTDLQLDDIADVRPFFLAPELWRHQEIRGCRQRQGHTDGGPQAVDEHNEERSPSFFLASHFDFILDETRGPHRSPA